MIQILVQDIQEQPGNKLGTHNINIENKLFMDAHNTLMILWPICKIVFGSDYQSDFVQWPLCEKVILTIKEFLEQIGDVQCHL